MNLDANLVFMSAASPTNKQTTPHWTDSRFGTSLGQCWAGAEGAAAHPTVTKTDTHGNHVHESHYD